MVLLLIIQTACSNYSSKFECGVSRGVNCMMLRNIDNQIDSGEIERSYNNTASTTKCSGKRCGVSINSNSNRIGVKTHTQYINVLSRDPKDSGKIITNYEPGKSLDTINNVENVDTVDNANPEESKPLPGRDKL